MNNNCHVKFTVIIYHLLILGFIFPSSASAQESHTSGYSRDSLLLAAKEIMASTSFCALITLDKKGHPQVRTMDPFLPDHEMVIWMGTNSKSRKVQEINRDSRVTLYYEAPEGRGYVVIQGNARIVDDEQKKKKYWKKEWKAYYTNKEMDFILIKVVPQKVEIVDYKYNIVGKSGTWEVPYINFQPKE